MANRGEAKGEKRQKRAESEAKGEHRTTGSPCYEAAPSPETLQQTGQNDNNTMRVYIIP